MLSLKKLTCHCGAVEIQVNLNDNIDKLKRCNCSMCKRKGTMVATIEKKDLKVIKGINMGCIDDIEVNELFKFKTFINDGQNHIKDRK